MKFRKTKPRSSRGFTLLEVLIAMLVTAVGLLGLAKMQSLALSASKESGVRSLIALQTASLTAAMHGNRAFWATLAAPLVATASGTTIVNATLANDAGAACETTSCTPAVLAAKDMQTWVRDLNQQFPSYSARVTCTAAPVSCIIFLNWDEKQVAITSTTQAQADAVAATITKPSFSVHVKP
ncbi:MAG: type IV pilus modification protein PilV [Pseudomonadota bacterium]